MAVAFSPLPTTTTVERIRPSTSLNGGGSAFTTSPAGKRATVETVKSKLETSEMVFSMSASSLTVAQMRKLRLAVPKTTTVKVVKNTLMERAVEGTEFQGLLESDLLTGANMWFFIEEDIAGTISAVNTFVKENGKKDSHTILGGVLESTVYDAAGVEAIGKLPSKQDLYARIAGSIKAVPTKVARVIKAPSSKLARAIKLATAEDKEE
ncbi:hypothetical protein ACA910_009368 [Epithemia clementina (nom. ined.)]